MEELKKQFDHVYIDEEAVVDPVAQRFLQIFSPDKISIVNEPPLSQRGTLDAESFDRSKRLIHVRRHQGAFFKRCPGAKPGLVCCNYFVLNLGLQCHMNCSYCYLQDYINTPMLTVYSNVDQALSELEMIAKAHPDKPYRVGTGETIDSLGLDPLTEYSKTLISFFRKFPKWSLELKTKSDHVDQFLNEEHAGNVIVSWSINPQAVIEHEEHGTASLERRLKAAEKCVQRGFKVTFHMDPMIWHTEWQKNYQEMVNQITSRFKPEQLAPMSVGTLRFQPNQKHMMRERFGMQSWVTSAETFRSRDGKMRYDGQVRQKMYQFIVNAFKTHSRDWRVALCMETPESWAMSMDGSPRKDRKMEDLFKPLPKIKRPEDALLKSEN